MKPVVVLSLMFLAGLALSSSASAVAFTNPAPITIPSGAPGTTTGPASPYPSPITVSGLTGTITKVTVTLNSLSHTYPDDIDVLLVGPTGANLILMSDACGDPDLVAASFTFDDTAAATLDADGPCGAGTFDPTNAAPDDTFPAPAPAPTAATTLATFNTTNPNGTWNLYIVDDISQDVGSVAGGWTLNITTTTTAVRLRSFAARSSSKGPVVAWRTASQVDVLGFNVWREGRKLNRPLIAARGRGALYRFVDRSARPGRRYTYRLQVLNLDGTRSWEGRATVVDRR